MTKKLSKSLALFSMIFILIFSACAQSVLADEDTDTSSDVTTEETTSSDSSSTASTGTWPAAPTLDAGAVYLVEANNGCVLNAVNETEKMYPASTTKLMTCLLALENCSLDETVTFSETAVTLEEGSSNIGAVAGEEMAMRDVLYGLMISSGNECANAIAEHISGSVEAFAELMNKRAEELGCENTHFVNPHGLYNKDHYTTAKDLSLIAREAYKNSTFVDIISHASYTIEPTNKDPNQKKLSTTVESIKPTSSYYNEYVIGGKTGYLAEAGRCLVVFAKKDGVSLVSVLLKSGYETVFDETNKNLAYGFDNFIIKNVSESESRFSYTDEKCKVYLDPKSEIVMPNSISFDDLDAEMTYVSDMDQDTRTAIFKEIGMTPDESLRLYAKLSYSYDGHSLGQVYVLLDSSMTVSAASFTNVFYVNIWYVIAGVVVLLIVIFVVIRKPKVRRRHR